jgi:hypothetical protein
MKAQTYAALESARSEFLSLVSRIDAENPRLKTLQEGLRKELGYDDYRVETPVVYNRALDEVTAKDRLDYILVADNPGKKEQLEANNRYLVGQSGKLAQGFFEKRLGVDFRKEVVILNKTPIHTPKTAELRRLLALADARGPKEGAALRASFGESQRAMAGIARGLHGASGAVLWISGLGELGPKGLFQPYAEALEIAYRGASPSLKRRVWLFRHFSMNQFAIEVKQNADPARPIIEELERIGLENRMRVLGW